MNITKKMTKEIVSDWDDAITQLVYDTEFGEEELHAVDWSRFGEWLIMEKTQNWLTDNALRESYNEDFLDYALYGGTECRRYYRAYGDAQLAFKKFNYDVSAAHADMLKVMEEQFALGMVAAYDGFLYSSALLAAMNFHYDAKKAMEKA